VEVGADQVVGGRFAGGIGRARIVGGCLLKRAGFAERAVNFVGADVQEAAGVF